ncbi:MAG: hypothetical protein JJU36_06250 [Phycisphaeraceae bacterium]|nr:hypothetical protein [Phycisphaeraceae bacterium]
MNETNGPSRESLEAQKREYFEMMQARHQTADRRMRLAAALIVPIIATFIFLQLVSGDSGWRDDTTWAAFAGMVLSTVMVTFWALVGLSNDRKACVRASAAYNKVARQLGYHRDIYEYGHLCRRVYLDDEAGEIDDPADSANLYPLFLGPSLALIFGCGVLIVFMLVVTTLHLR